MAETYAELLRKLGWQKKRVEILERDKWTCRECGAADKTLTVHHAYYIPGREPWNYPNESLRCLCEKCHKAHAEMDRLIAIFLQEKSLKVKAAVLRKMCDVVNAAEVAA